jgi:hypothetical protein
MRHGFLLLLLLCLPCTQLINQLQGSRPEEERSQRLSALLQPPPARISTAGLSRYDGNAAPEADQPSRAAVRPRPSNNERTAQGEEMADAVQKLLCSPRVATGGS